MKPLNDRIEIFRGLVDYCGYKSKMSFDEESTKTEKTTEELVNEFKRDFLNVQEGISEIAMTGMAGSLFNLYLDKKYKLF